MVGSARRDKLTSPQMGRYAAVLALLVLAGFALRLPLLDRYPLREDEAIYSYWALHGWYEDPLFLHVWPDKPPVFIWLLSCAFQLWGAIPASARIVNVAASTLTIPVLATTARRWWGNGAGLIAAAFLALNPFAISFAPTAYTDSTLLLMGALAICSVALRRYLFAGLWLALAIMTKQQGLLFLPLVVAAAWPDFRRREMAPPPQAKQTARRPAAQNVKRLRPALGRFLLGILLVIAPILFWDSLRWSVAPSPWDLGRQNVGAIALVEPGNWLPRLYGWLPVAGYLVGNALEWTLWILVVGGAVLTALLSPRSEFPARVLLMATWLIGFALVHIVTTVQIWDRYLLPAILPLTLLAGWAGSRWATLFYAQPQTMPDADPVDGENHGRRLSRRIVTIVVASLLVLGIYPVALRAADGQLPVGADHGAYAGLDAALAWVAEYAPPGTIVYHQTLGWQARFYLYEPVHQNAIELRWYPNAVYLADNALKMPHRERLLVVPSWAPDRDLELQLATRLLKAGQRFRAGNFIVYAIGPATKTPDRSGAATAWRVCPMPNADFRAPFAVPGTEFAAGLKRSLP